MCGGGLSAAVQAKSLDIDRSGLLPDSQDLAYFAPGDTNVFARPSRALTRFTTGARLAYREQHLCGSSRRYPALGYAAANITTDATGPTAHGITKGTRQIR